MAKKWILGFLVLVILTASVYVLLPDKVRIDVEKTKTIFKVYEDNSWVLAGTERTIIYDGTTKMRAKSRVVNFTIDGKTTTIYRYAYFKDNITAIDTYIFDGTIEDVEMYPVNHNVQILNGDGKIFVYEVKDLLYTGETVKDIESPQSFGHKMKVEWEEGNYYSKIYKYLNKDVGKLTIKYRIDSNNFSKSVRLSDPFAGGAGTRADPYQISNCTQLNEINDDLQAAYILINDINCSDTVNWNGGLGFEPIGKNNTAGYMFNGSFDGRGYTINELFINRSTQDFIGLFGVILNQNSAGSNVTLKNFTIENSQFYGKDYVGAVIGAHNSGTDSTGERKDMSVINTTVEGNNLVGGWIGDHAMGADANNIRVSNLYIDVTVTGNDNVGGVGGRMASGNDNAWYHIIVYANINATGDGVGGFSSSSKNGGSGYNITLYVNVTGEDNVGGYMGSTGGNNFRITQNIFVYGNIIGNNNVGGIAGVGGRQSYLRTSFEGNVTGNDNVGGLFGSASAETTVNLSYSLGYVTGNDSVGGLAGVSAGTTQYISNSYSWSTVSGNSYVGGLIGKNSAPLLNSYSVGEVSGTTYVGGLIGNSTKAVNNSFWDLNTSGQATSASGTGKTTIEMKILPTFNDTATEGLNESWDIVLNQDHVGENWFINNESGYPRLGWEGAIVSLLTGVVNNTIFYIKEIGFSKKEINFVANISDPGSLIKNVTLFINGNSNLSNSSKLTGIYNFSLNLSSGSYNYTIVVYDTRNVLYTSVNGTLDFQVIEINITLNTNITFTFTSSNSTQLEIQPPGQNSTHGTFVMNNTLDANVNVYASLSEVYPGAGNITFKIGNSSNYSLSVIINTSNIKIYNNLTINSAAELWSWADYNNTLQSWTPGLIMTVEES